MSLFAWRLALSISAKPKGIRDIATRSLSNRHLHTPPQPQNDGEPTGPLAGIKVLFLALHHNFNQFSGKLARVFLLEGPRSGSSGGRQLLWGAPFILRGRCHKSWAPKQGWCSEVPASFGFLRNVTLVAHLCKQEAASAGNCLLLDVFCKALLSLRPFKNGSVAISLPRSGWRVRASS